MLSYATCMCSRCEKTLRVNIDSFLSFNERTDCPQYNCKRNTSRRRFGPFEKQDEIPTATKPNTVSRRVIPINRCRYRHLRGITAKMIRQIIPRRIRAAQRGPAVAVHSISDRFPFCSRSSPPTARRFRPPLGRLRPRPRGNKIIYYNANKTGGNNATMTGTTGSLFHDRVDNREI